MINNTKLPLAIILLMATTAHADSLEVSDTELNTLSPILYQESIDSAYKESLAENSVALAEAASSLALLANTSAEETIEGNNYTYWKVTYQCVFDTYHTLQSWNPDFKLYSYPTATGLITENIPYGGVKYNFSKLSFTPDGYNASGTAECPGYSVTLY